MKSSLLIIICSSLIDCSSPTENSTGSLSGTVALINDSGNSANDPIDFAGVTIAIYNLAILDSTIVRINHEYPNIGVQINQETEFDHRLQNPIKVASTNSDGSFKLKKIPAGKYNLVFLKQGWGFRYIYNFNITSGENTLSLEKQYSHSKGDYSKLNEVILYPEMIMPVVILETMVFEPYHAYRFLENTSLLGNVEINESSMLLIDPNKRVDVHGIVACNSIDNYCKISSSFNIYSVTKADSIEAFYQFTVLNQAIPISITKIIFECSVNGLQFTNNDVTLTNSIIRENSNSALTLLSNSSNLSNNLFVSNENKGILAYNVTQIGQSVFVNNHDNCLLSETVSTISNNYIIDSHIGLRPFYGTNNIQYNCFDRNSVAIAPCASNPIIAWNNFYDNNRDIELNHYYVQGNLYDYCSPDIHNNNFLGNGFYIHLMGVHSLYGDGGAPNMGVNENQVYPYNYLQATELVTHIYDANNPLAINFPFTVAFIPRLSSPISQAGVQL